jgi:hypothetical protein
LLTASGRKDPQATATAEDGLPPVEGEIDSVFPQLRKAVPASFRPERRARRLFTGRHIEVLACGSGIRITGLP